MKKLLLPVCVALLASCQAPAPETTMVDNTASNKIMFQRFYDEVFNAHNPAMMDSFCTPDIFDHQGDPNHPEGIRGLEGVRASIAEFFTAYPDLHAQVNFIAGSGDTLMAHVTMTGTNSGPMGGMPPTNKQIRVDGVDVIVLKDGKCSEHWGYMEEAKMMMQLGMMPEGGATSDTTAVAGGSQPAM